MRLWRFAVAVCALWFLFGCASIGKVNLCATGEDLTDKGCVCKDGHVPDDDGKGCHLPEPTTTTTSSTTTSTTTTTTLPPATPRPPTIPPPAPTPAPTCIPEAPMPAGPVDVRSGLKPSSCTEPGENRRCFKDGAGSSGVRWEADERACWPAWAVAEQGGRVPKLLGGVTLYCEPGYLSDPDDTSRGCFDAWGRRYKWDGGAWREQVLSDRFSGWWLGICPARAPKVCEAPRPLPEPLPLPPGQNPAWCSTRQECAAGQSDPGVYGCCRDVGQHGAWAGPSRFEGVVEEVLEKLISQRGSDVVYREADSDVVKEQKENAFVAEVANAIRARGLCTTTRAETPRGGTPDEVGVKDSDGRSEQFDVVLSGGKVRRRGYVAVCMPARF